MSSNLDQLKSAYEAFARGDVEAAFADLDEQCTFHAGSDFLPAGGDFHGKQEIMGRWLPELAANFQDLRMDIEETIEEGDSICVTGTMRANVAGTDIKGPFCHIWHYRDGKVVDARFFAPEAEAMMAMQRQGADIGSAHN